MKKIRNIAVAVVVLVALVWVITPSEKFDEDLAGDTMRVSYEKVNVRTEPNTDSEIVDQRYLGAEVELTGNVYSSIFDTNVAWYETSDGNWITANALLPDYVYEARFGN